MRRARADDEPLTLPDRPQKESELGLTVWGWRQTKAEVPIDGFQRPVSLLGSGSNNGLVRSSTYIASPNLLMAQPMDPISSRRLGRCKIFETDEATSKHESESLQMGLLLVKDASAYRINSLDQMRVSYDHSRRMGRCYRLCMPPLSEHADIDPFTPLYGRNKSFYSLFVLRRSILSIFSHKSGRSGGLLKHCASHAPATRIYSYILF